MAIYICKICGEYADDDHEPGTEYKDGLIDCEEEDDERE